MDMLVICLVRAQSEAPQQIQNRLSWSPIRHRSAKGVEGGKGLHAFACAAYSQSRAKPMALFIIVAQLTHTTLIARHTDYYKLYMHMGAVTTLVCHWHSHSHTSSGSDLGAHITSTSLVAATTGQCSSMTWCSMDPCTTHCFFQT